MFPPCATPRGGTEGSKKTVPPRARGHGRGFSSSATRSPRLLSPPPLAHPSPGRSPIPSSKQGNGAPGKGAKAPSAPRWHKQCSAVLEPWRGSPGLGSRVWLVGFTVPPQGGQRPAQGTVGARKCLVGGEILAGGQARVLAPALPPPGSEPQFPHLRIRTTQCPLPQRAPETVLIPATLQAGPAGTTGAEETNSANSASSLCRGPFYK